jgi:hypothetical protein
VVAIQTRALAGLIAGVFAEASAQSPMVVDHRQSPVPAVRWSIGSGCTNVGAPSTTLPDGLYRTTSATRISNGTIVVGTNVNVSLLYFGTGGNVVARAGGRGGGPGEIDGPAVFIYRYRGDSILAHSVGRGAAQMSIFGPDGKFARTFRLTPKEGLNPGLIVGSSLRDGSIVTRVGTGMIPMRAGEADRIQTDSTTLRTYDASGAERWTSARIADVVSGRAAPQRARGSGRGFTISMRGVIPGRVSRWNAGAANTLAAGVEVIYHFEEPADALVIYNPAGAVRRRVLLRPLEDALRPGPGRAVPIADAQVLELFADREGRAWVEVKRDKLDGNRVWWVFDAQGRWLAEATTPPRPVRLLEIGGDYILMLKTDRDDLERVESCPIVRGRP